MIDRRNDKPESVPVGRSELDRQQWIVSMLDARQHYAPARALHSLGCLRLFYTDIWCRFGRAILLKGPADARRWAGRFHPDLPGRQVRAFNASGIADLCVARGLSRISANQSTGQIRRGQRFAQRVARDLARQHFQTFPDVFMGFTCGCLETLQSLPSSTLKVVDQVDASAVHFEVLRKECAKWPGWQVFHGTPSDRYFLRVQNEWKLANALFVNSNWSKTALIQQGVAPERIFIGPLAYERSVVPISRPAHHGPLKVLWLANVHLGKGIQYLIEAAKGLHPTRFEFTIVGAISITDQAISQAPRNMRFVGQVSRERTSTHYANADVYVLPTLSDGFAITQIEAMAHGLPVIATERCGEVVSDDVDGILVPAGNADALRVALERLERNRDHLRAMGEKALDKSKSFSLDRYARTLMQGLSKTLARCGSTGAQP